MKSKEKAVQNALIGFHFAKAAKAIAGCDWRWNGGEKFLDQEELREIAADICRKVVEMGNGLVQRGPLLAMISNYIEDGEESPAAKAVLTLELYLVPVFSSVVYVDESILNKAEAAAAEAPLHPQAPSISSPAKEGTNVSS